LYYYISDSPIQVWVMPPDNLHLITLSTPLFFDGDGLSAPAKNGASLIGGGRRQGAT
jgi:hypothetical protein